MSTFSCPSCLRRAVRNLTLDSPAPSTLLTNTSIRTSTQTDSARGTTKRHHATYDSLVRGHHRRALRTALTSKTPIQPNARRKAAGSLTKGEIRDALARDNNRKLLLNKDDSNLTRDEQKVQYRLKKDIEQYYSDPLQLANAVTQKLRVPDFNGAIALVRASEGLVPNNVVSWNHCIDWCMLQGDTEKAWKLYNELKKRGHKPDSFTYTIMLRGLSQNSRKADSAQRAVSVYNSMFMPNSAVEPITIHTNAALNVCAKTRDMESLWAIAGRLPERGHGSPDRRTFTTILNAIMEDATAKVADLLKNPKPADGQEDMSLEDRQKIIFEEALKDGRKLWGDISYRWRRADLVIDETLVCAMGRLVVGCGTTKDYDEVFDLVDSTMNIRLAERGHLKGAAADVEVIEEENEHPDDYSSSKPKLALAGVDKSLPLSEQQVYATPSNNTLSLILEAATGARSMKLGKAYWHVLTTPNGSYKITPDAENIIAYLRLLRISRGSKDALDVLSRDWPAPVAEKLYRRGTFVIAMSTCVRDKNNPKVFEVADKLLGLMQSKLEEVRVGMYDKIDATENDPNLSYKERQAIAKARVADVDDITFGEDEALSEIQRTKSGVESSTIDPKALRMYLDLAVLKTTGWNEGLAGKENSEEMFERNPTKNTTLRALRRLSPDMVYIYRLAKLKLLEAEVGSRSHPEARKQDFSRNAQRRINDRAGTRVAERLEDMIDLLRSIVSACDKVISIDERFQDQNRPQIDQKLIERYRGLKRQVSAFLTRTKDEVQKITRGSMKYAKWRTQENNTDKDEDDEAEYSDALSTRSTELPKLGREIQRIYDDTDRSLGRLEQRSRRQRLERKNGVQARMLKRLGTGEDPGTLDDDLTIQQSREVRERMRSRAFGIRVPDSRGRDDESRGHMPYREMDKGFERRLNVRDGVVV